MNAAFDAERFETLARGLTLGRPCVVSAVTDSTNDDALAAARDGARHGALFVTEAQRQGRGRRGNVWHAASGEALLFSLVLRPELAAERAPALALVAGLAVRAAVAHELSAAGASARALVKWPNDVVVDGRKVAGILVESHVRGQALGAAVVGVGLNVGRMELPPDVEAKAVSLSALGAPVAREALLVRVLGELEARLARLERQELPLQGLIEELARHDALFGMRISVGELSGTGAGIDADGFLELLDGSGRTHKVCGGHVTLAEAPQN